MTNYPPLDIEIKLYDEEMEADHIKPWHEGGKTNSKNCQMLCKQEIELNLENKHSSQRF